MRVLERLGVELTPVRAHVVELMGGLPPAYREPRSDNLSSARRVPAGYLGQPVLPEAKLDRAAWEVLCWRQGHLPLRALRHVRDWGYLYHLESEAAERVYRRLRLHEDQERSLQEHHLRRVWDLAHQARPELVPAPAEANLPNPGGALALTAPPSEERQADPWASRRLRPGFLAGWACWFGNRWAGIRYRWLWVNLRLFAVRTRSSYRHQPRTSGHSQRELGRTL